MFDRLNKTIVNASSFQLLGIHPASEGREHDKRKAQRSDRDNDNPSHQQHSLPQRLRHRTNQHIFQKAEIAGEPAGEFTDPVLSEELHRHRD